MKRCLLLLATLIIGVGCQQLDKDIDKLPDNVVNNGTDEVPDAELEVDKSEFELDYSAQRIEISVRTNRELEVDVCVDWITSTIADSGDRVVLQIMENTEQEPRSAEVAIIAGEQICSITILQGVKPEIMELCLEHSSAHLDSPKWSGYDITGVVDWGDGTTEEYSEGISHHYSDTQKHSAQFRMEGATSFYIEQIGDIESVILAI